MWPLLFLLYSVIINCLESDICGRLIWSKMATKVLKYNLRLHFWLNDNTSHSLKGLHFITCVHPLLFFFLFCFTVIIIVWSFVSWFRDHRFPPYSINHTTINTCIAFTLLIMHIFQIDQITDISLIVHWLILFVFLLAVVKALLPGQGDLSDSQKHCRKALSPADQGDAFRLLLFFLFYF